MEARFRNKTLPSDFSKARTIMFLFSHHAIMIAEKGSKSKKKRLSAVVTAFLQNTYGTQ
jgi:hypothetical protein